MSGPGYGPLGRGAPAVSLPADMTNDALYSRWWPLADKDGDGRVTGPDAVEFFQLSGLPRDQLAKVWAFADNSRRGYLDYSAFVRALELISLAQNSGNVSMDAYNAQKAVGIMPPRLSGLSTSSTNTSSPSGLRGSAGGNPFGSVDGTSSRDSPSFMTAPISPSGGTGNSAGAPPPSFYFGGPGSLPGEYQQVSPRSGRMPTSSAADGGAGSDGGGGGGGSAFATTPTPSTQQHQPQQQYQQQPQQQHRPVAAAAAATHSVQPPLSSAKTANRRRGATMSTKDVTSITDGLRRIYFAKIRPLEEMYRFGHFFSPLMNDGDFEAKPSVLLLGQYSTGKSTFIKYLLGRDYPGLHIGPEPTTDRFVVVMHGPEDRRTPGNTLVVQPDKPYTGLSQFGNGFLSKFEAATCENRLLEEITLVDTPGVLSGEKQRIERSYDFIQVCGWFAARCDLVLLLFDPYKLDISDEFKAVISTLRGHDDKVRVVLNKADSVDQQQLMRVYGALMWSLGKVFKTPEVCRVYIGSFNAGHPIREDVNPTGKVLFEKEQEDLLHDLYDIPARSCDRKVNEFVKRVRAARIHFLIMGHLRAKMPYFGQKKAQEKLLNNLAEEFLHVQREHHLHPGDFPDVKRYREILSAFDISKFPKLDKNMIKQVDDALSVDIPNLVRAMDNPFNG